MTPKEIGIIQPPRQRNWLVQHKSGGLDHTNELYGGKDLCKVERHGPQHDCVDYPRKTKQGEA